MSRVKCKLRLRIAAAGYLAYRLALSAASYNNEKSIHSTSAWSKMESLISAQMGAQLSFKLLKNRGFSLH